MKILIKLTLVLCILNLISCSNLIGWSKEENKFKDLYVYLEEFNKLEISNIEDKKKLSIQNELNEKTIEIKKNKKEDQILNYLKNFNLTLETKSLCNITNNLVTNCDRYECKDNNCFCNENYNLSISINWPIKYLCLNKISFNEDCLIDQQCTGTHQYCTNQMNLQNYINKDVYLDYFNKFNYTTDVKQSFMNQMSMIYNQTKLFEQKGKCKCKEGYFFNYLISYSKNKHVNKHLSTFLNENKITNLTDLFSKPKNLFIGHCLKIRKLDESCEINSECQNHDPSSICRKSKCKCKTGFQIDLKNDSNVLIDQDNITDTHNSSKLICEPILNLNFDINHHNNLSIVNRNNQIKKALNKNCSEDCDGRHNCVKKNKRIHVQENFASLVWTILCMLSIMLVLCMLLVKNKQDDNLELSHNYNNYFLHNSSSNNINQTTSFLNSVFNRNYSNNATELQNVNERNLISRTPPPEFNDIMDEPPTYEEAVLMLQKNDSIKDI